MSNKNKQVIIHGLLQDVIDYKALIEHQASQGVTRITIPMQEETKRRQKVKQFKNMNRK